MKEMGAKRLDIPFDTDLAGQLELKVDLCAFKRVKAHFRNPDSEIFQVIIAQGDYLLHEVAAIFEGSERREEELLDELFRSGVIRAGVDNMAVVWSDYRKYAVLLDTIDDDQLCYFIYLPPAYFVKVTDKKPAIRKGEFLRWGVGLNHESLKKHEKGRKRRKKGQVKPQSQT